MEKKINIGKLEIVYWYDFPCFELSFAKCDYFDGRPTITIELLFWHIVFHLPWINKNWTDECDPPQYGIAIHHNTLWIYRGGKGNLNGGNKWWTWDIPFITWNFYGHYIMGKNGKWIDVTNRDYYYKEVGYIDWREQEISDEDSPAMIYYGKWTDGYDGSIIDAKYRVEKRIWRPKWLTWTKLFQKQRKEIEVCFKDEVGSRKGSWKGGVVGAGHTFKDDKETPEECFRRMNYEKNW